MSFRDSIAGFSYEKRPLKRARLGPPDVYPQEPRQREDELTAINVKQGFSHLPQLSDEFGTAKNINLSAAKLGTFINGTIAKKAELNALPDSGGKRRLQVNTKDHFWPVTPRLKNVVDMYMKDLAGTKPLPILAKRVPIFNKREEIFLTLADYSVPLFRAAWFLKMTASYNSAISEAKTKKRQMPDPTQEWTVSLLRCLKDILLRLSDWHNGGSGTGNLFGSNSNPGSNSSLGGGSSLTPTHTSSAIGSTPSPEDGGQSLLHQWQYCTELAKHLHEAGLLDRFDWLQWIIDACDRMRTLEDGGWKALVPLLLAFIPDIAQSELLARRLAHLAARRLSALFAEMETPPSFSAPIQPPAMLLEHLHCPFHRSTVLSLVSALQVIVIECPTALVFNGNNFSPASSPNYGSVENTRTTLPPGSPLDLIAVSPSALPMPPRANNPIIRLQLRSTEELIRLRSRAVEAKWACEEWQQSSAGPTLQKVLAALEALDSYSFDKIENSNSIESLYLKMFASTPICKDSPVENDAPIVLLLCQWAVGPHRSGDHRALVVARLLEHRQNLVTTSFQEQDGGSQNALNSTSSENSKNENMSGDEVTTNGTDTNSGSESQGTNGVLPEVPKNTNNGNGQDETEAEGYTGLPIYHNLLFKYLDTDAPTLDDTTNSSKVKFSSLVHLFAALIRHDIFSHDTYLCTLVARGDLSAFPPPPLPPTGQSGMQQIQSVATPGQGPGSHAGPCTPASVSSTVTPGATPHHDLMDDGSGRSGGVGPLFQPLPRLQEAPHRHQDYDDRMDNIDDDLDRILRHITQEQQENMDQIDSPKEDNNIPGFASIQSSHQPPNSNSNSQSDSAGNSRSGGAGGTPNHNNMNISPMEVSRQSRHRLYVTHFPLPQDEVYQHEANQRHILLYGFGRARDESKHMVKKISKDLTKLFTKKFCYDIADGSRVKKHSKNEISLENLQTKFMGLPYFDQHALTSSTASTVLEMLSSFAAGRSSYLPTVEHITFLTELMEVGLNVMGIIETTVQILRELPDVDAQLNQRGSPIGSQFTTGLLMQVVAILRRYHCSLLLDPELTSEAWEGLLRVMRRFTSPFDCTSAERCTLAYLTDLQNSCNFLRSKNFAELLNPISAKLRLSLCTAVQSTLESSYGFNNSFMTQCLDNPRRKVDLQIIRQLNDSGTCRYSFVCNSVLSICNEADAERLNDLASLCAEMTAVCPALAPEWLGVLQSLCSPSRHVAAYADVLAEIDVKHLSIHSSLATLTAMLVARQCFTLQDIVVQAVPSLLKAWNESRGPRDTDTEAGARLTCYLLLSLFKTHDVMNPNMQPCILKLSSDRRLLSATHTSITLGAVLAALKAMLLLADAAITNERRREQRPGMPPGELSISHILGTSDVLPLERNDGIRPEPRTLATFALSSLQQMCAEPWVRQRCLRNPVELCQEDMLLDPIVSTRQAQRLLHLICYPELVIPDDVLEPRTQVPRIIMERLDQWNLREAWVALTLQNRQLLNNSAEYQGWLDTVARSALEVFHLGEEAGQEYVIPHSATPSPAPGKSPRSGKKGQQDSMAKTPPNNQNRSTSGDRGNLSDRKSEGRGISAASAWLVAPLVEKLSTQVQGRVLRHAGTVLESTLWPKTAPKKASGTGLHSHLPFLALILTCLRGQDEQRESLLQSLLTQFTQLLQYAKEAVIPNSENKIQRVIGGAKTEGKLDFYEQDAEGKTETLRDALRLRLSLVGGMFDAVQRSTQATAEWAVVLTQLVTHSVVDLNTNSDVFFTVVDMVTALVHSTQVTEAGDRVEEVRKQNLNLIKKLRKELTERESESIKPLRQLLPFSRVFAEIIVTQSTSTIVDSKGNRVQSFEYVDKKPGLQVWEKQRVSPWEILEGQRNPAPLSWAWFGAVKMERKPLRYEEAHRLNKFHTHNFVKPFTHFLEPVPLPPEEIDVKPEIHIREEIILKPDTPISMMSDQSPRGSITKVAKPKVPRKKRLTKAQQEQQKLAQAAAAQAQQQQQQQQMNVPIPNAPTMPNQIGNQFGGQNPMGPGGNQPPPNYQPGPPQWYNGQPQQQPPPQQPPQQPYYPAQPGPGPPGGPKMNQSKAALHSLLRARTVSPGGPNQFQQFPPGPTGPAPGQNPRQGILRQQLRGPSQAPGQMAHPGQGQTFQAGPPPNPNPMLQQQQQQQHMQQTQGINQNYGYNNQAGQPQGVPVQQGGLGGPHGMNTQQGQMGAPRGPVHQDFMGAVGNRPMGPRGNVPFMQGGPPQQQGMGAPMQPSYPNRPNMPQQGSIPGQMQAGQMSQSGVIIAGQMQGGQMTQGQMTQMPQQAGIPQMQGGQINQLSQQGGISGQVQGGMPGQGQMIQGGMQGQIVQGGMQGQGQMVQGGMQGQGQMVQGGMQGQGQMVQGGMQGQGQMVQGGMQGQGQMVQGGIQGQGQMVQGQMVQGGIQGQMGQGGMQGQGQMGQGGMQGQGQMGQGGMQGQMVGPGGMGQGGMMGAGPQQRMMVRQQMMIQQQQMRQPGMGPGQQMHYNPNQQGGY